jgi:hypothetical protein
MEKLDFWRIILKKLLKFTKLLVEDKNLRKKLGRNSYNFVRRRFDWNLTVKEYR